MSPEFDIFRLTYSGKCERLSKDNILSKFTLFDTLVFYIIALKRLYIWIGKRASQNLKSYIPQLRDILLEEDPHYMILRNYTIESGSEPENFLDMIGISKDDLDKRIKDLETKIRPSILEINRLKEKAENHFISEEYNQAIDASDKITELAIQINDKSLEQDQKNFIKDIQSRIKIVESLEDLKKVTVKKIALFDYLTSNDDFHEAHNLVKNFIDKYEKLYPLDSIPIAQQLILKDKNLVYNLKLKQEAMKSEFERLENEFLNNYDDFSRIRQIITKLKTRYKKIFDDEFTTRYKTLKNKYQKLKKEKLDYINNLTNEAIENLEQDKEQVALELFERVVNSLEDFVDK